MLPFCYHLVINSKPALFGRAVPLISGCRVSGIMPFMQDSMPTGMTGVL
jgi:hypothetical protein